MQRPSTTWLALALVLMALGCDEADAPDAGVEMPDAADVDASADAAPDPDRGALADAAVDGSADPVDRGTDGPMSAPDAAVDAELDAASDAVVDAVVDAKVDAMVDAMPDAMPDAMVDAMPDAMVDAVPDAEPPPVLRPVQITEVAARNGGELLDEDDEPSDWIELYNPNGEAVSLLDHRLSDAFDLRGGWTLPAVEVPARGYLVVFASGKDRNDPAGPLHTDFRLDAGGETLALLDPDGGVVDALFAWPQQVEGLTWGRPMRVDRQRIQSEAARRAPLPAAPAGWTAVDFDAAGWPEVFLPFGFDRAEPPRPARELARSDVDFSGTQGERGWFYGYIEGDAYAADAFVPFPDADGPWSPDNFWNGEGWRWFDGDPPWTRLDAAGGQPNGPDGGPVHMAVRRWISPVDGPLQIDGRCENPAAAGDGVRCRVMHGGVELVSVSVNGRGDDLVAAAQVQAGDPVDFVLDHGPATGAADGAIFTARIVVPGVDADPDDLGAPVADSVADWSPIGEQGAGGWTYGYADRTAVAPAPYSAAHFVPFPRDRGGHSATDFWNGSSYDWFAGNPPWTMLGQVDVHPNGINNGVEHWAIRRYTATVGGAHLVRWAVRKANPNAQGVTGRLWHGHADGTDELDVAAIAGNDAVGVERLVAVHLEPGDVIDLAVDPTGPQGDRRDFSDGSQSEMRIWSAVDLTPLLAEQDEGPAGAGAALRMPVDVPEGADRVDIELRYDDGVVVWLDGAEIYADGAPDRPLEAGAIATGDRPTGAALTPVVIEVPDALAGPSVLAVAALDAPGDDRFFIDARPFAVRVAVERAVRYLEPTPGADNTPPVDRGPLVFDLTRDPPAIPDTPVTVVASVAPTAAEVVSARLTWRVGFEPEQTVEMEAEGDRWTVTLPAEVMTPGALIRWFVEAEDADGRITREPPFPDPLDSEQYFGTVVADPSIESALPVLHWFVERPELADRPTGTRSVMWFDGELYDNILADIHGQSTRGFPKKSYDIDFNRDHRFRLRDDLRRMKDINLLSNYADKSKVRNTMAYALLVAAGADHHLAFPVRVQQNGAFFSIADFVEDGDDRWIERLGYDPVGALYKVYDGVYNAGRGEKKTRKDEGNEDYAALIAGLRLDPAARRTFLYDNLDLARMANYLAGSFIHAGVDCCHKNFYLYRSATTLQWWMMTWDVDLSLGRVWTGSYFDDRMYPETGLFIGRDIGGQNQLLHALYADPDFVEMYLRRTRTLVDQLLQRPDTPLDAREMETRIDALVARIGADADLDAERWRTWGEPQTMVEAARRIKEDWVQPRRAFVYGTLARQSPAQVLIPGDAGAAMGRYRVPVEDDPMATWTALDFDDADWIEGPLGVGYENSPAQYDPLIGTVVRPNAVNPDATTVQVRVPFEVEDPAALETLTLSMKYDDGYVAWLNGVEIARRNVNGPPTWNGIADLHDDNRAVQFEGVDVTAAIELMVPGTNVLAVVVMNNGAGSSDLLMQPALQDGVAGGGILPPAAQPDDTVEIVDFEAADAPGESWIELHNPGAEAVDISGWGLRGGGIEHDFTPGTVVPGDGRIWVVQTITAFRERAESPRGGEGRFVQGDWRGALDPGAGPVEVLRPEELPVDEPEAPVEE